MNPYTHRRQRLSQLLKEEQIDGLFITNQVNVTYLTGFSGDSSYLVLTAEKELLISDGRYAEQIAEECPGLETHIRPPSQVLPVAVAEVLPKLGLRSVGFESGSMTVADLERYRSLMPTLEWKPGADRVEQMRMVKDETEVAAIREAIRFAERAFAMFRAMLRPEDTEKELHDAMEMYIRRAGGRCSAFPPIIAVGPRAALAHAPPSKARVAGGNLLLVDWGANGPAYKSDLTRVLIPRNHSTFSRSPGDRDNRRETKTDAQLAKVYAAVREAQERAIRRIRAGVSAKDVDAVARNAIDEAGFGSFFIHGLGHGLGLQIHESPFLRASATEVLQAGMVITVEPGIYLPGWGGIRIEDDVLVTEDGCEVLTSVPKELDAMMVEF
jgi:Xaa-Pro aminopeptidase